MEPATHAVALEDAPADLLERVQAALATQGAPAITATQHDGRLVFECDTAELILRSRVADALTAAWPGCRA